MADEPTGISAWLSRAGPALELLNKIGFTTFLLIMVGLGVLWASGVIPLKPFDDLSAEHETLLKETRDSGAATVAALTAMVAAQKEQIAILSGIALRAQLVDCDKIKSKDARDRCFK